MRTVLVIVGLVLALAACGSEAASTADSPAPSESTDDTAEAVEQAPFVSVPFDDLGTNHIEPPVSFSNSPSIGGDHYPFWQNCGFYDVEVIEGAATHTLEHGAVWITYNEDLVTGDEVSTLQTLAADNSKLLISPYPHEERLVLSAWGVQQRTDAGPGDPVVAEFIEMWQDNPVLPEAGVTCLGAVGVAPSEPGLFEDGTEVPDEYR